jgi:hypothetical protein
MNLNINNFLLMSIPTPSPFPVFDDVPFEFRRIGMSLDGIPLINMITKDGPRQVFYDEASDDYYFFDTKELVPEVFRKGFNTTVFRRKCMDVKITYSKPIYHGRGINTGSLE